MSLKEDFIYCDTCRKYSNQLLLKELEDLIIIGNDSLLQKFKCGVCQRINKRILYNCWDCEKFTSQSLVDEESSELFAETMEQKFKCDVCGKINETSRYSDEFIQRFLNAKDEEGGVYCEHCMCYKKQELIDKQSDDFTPKLDLTTYKCKTCGQINYGTQRKDDVR